MNNNIELYGLKITQKSNKTRRKQHNKQVLNKTYKTVKKVLIMPFKIAYMGCYSIVKYIDGILFQSNFKKQNPIYNYLSIPETLFRNKKRYSKKKNKIITITNKNIVRL